MKFSFKFSNLFGAVYKKGDLVFTEDGNTLISPVGNRITLFDLKNNKSTALPVESRFNFTTLALSPDSTTLVAVNDQGEAHLISLISRSLVHRYHFKYPIGCVKFSPDGKYVAFAKGRTVNVFRAPGKYLGEYNPFVLEKVFHGAFDDVTCMDWSSDSAELICGSKDTTARVYSMKRSKKFRICKFSGHGDVLVGVYFEENSLNAWSISANGRIDRWEANMELSDIVEAQIEPPEAKKKCPDEEQDDEIDLLRGELRDSKLEEENDDSESDDEDAKLKRLAYTLNVKKYVKTNKAKVTTVSFHKKSKILVYGRGDGAFFLYELPEVNLIHSLSIADTTISRITFNATGDWVGLGCENHGQLLVWEWQSETYILKQQGHSASISCLEYSGDGQFIATGGEDGKVKLWNTTTGFSFVTFKDHSAAITAVKFARNRKFVVSASVDGTVRAFDLMRYRNFRTLTTPRPVQFASLAIDSSCEFVAAGGQDVFEVYLWSMKVGRLLEVLSGHEGPVVSLDFNPGLTSTELVSASWDKTVRIWNAIDSSMSNEVVRLGSDCLAVAYRPDGKEFAVATLDCQISFFDPSTAHQTGYVDGKNDLASGRSDTDLVTAKKSQQGKAFTSICYSADGDFIIAGGLLIYSLDNSTLFDPYMLEESITPASIRSAKNEKRHSDAIMMSLRLNERPLVKEVIESVPPTDIEICALNLPDVYVEKLLEFIAGVIESSKFIEFYLLWVKHLIVRTRSPPLNILLSLQKGIQKKYQDLSKLAYFNKYSIMLVKKMAASRTRNESSEDENNGELWGCGWNKYGQLGLGDEECVSTMKKLDVPSDVEVKTVVCGSWNTAVISCKD
ncbi:hypothetical protein GE061_005123 [Apolygus lucorum]|uniref:Small-subunit processome Utp12 domain-containing protein n=1 Tax=Apolygus lucorum TaxID=248454 RepID=A0A8S9WWT4_APOLU|nr:hypothetical protein GE061_005123 [Apolygus lucorum]